MFIGILLKLTMKEKKKTTINNNRKNKEADNVMLLQYKITIRKNINIRAVNTVS